MTLLPSNKDILKGYVKETNLLTVPLPNISMEITTL